MQQVVCDALVKSLKRKLAVTDAVAQVPAPHVSQKHPKIEWHLLRLPKLLQNAIPKEVIKLTSHEPFRRAPTRYVESPTEHFNVTPD